MKRQKYKTTKNYTKGVEIVGKNINCNIKNVKVKSSFSKVGKIKSENKDFHIPRLIGSLQGRDDELKNLSTWFFKDNKSMVVISGLAGYGKTQLARHFVENCKNEKKITNWLWINSESEDSMNDSFRYLHEMCNGNKNITNIMNIVDEVYKRNNSMSNLFVFDNAANRRSIAKFEPPKEHRSLCLITSHVTDWKFVKSLELKSLSVDNAVEVMRAVLKDRYEDDNLELYKKLVDILSCVPLALEMAAAYIREEMDMFKKFGKIFYLDKYIEDFDKSCKIIIHKPVPAWSTNSYNKSIYIAIEKSLHKIVENKDKIYRLAVKILHICAYLNSDNIHFSDVETVLWKNYKSKDITSDILHPLNILNNYSFIGIDKVEKKIIIHRLIQEFLFLNQEDIFRKQSNKYYFYCLQLLFTDNKFHNYSILKYAEKQIITFKKFYSTYEREILSVDIFLKNLIKAGCSIFLNEILTNLPTNINNKIDKYCLMHETVRHRQHDMLTLLLKHNPNVNKRDDRGKTPLLLATWLLNFDAVKILLKIKSTNIKATDEAGWSILHTLIYAFGELHNNVTSKEACKRFRWLEKCGADINAVTRRGETILHVAAAIIHPELVDCLVKEFHLNVNAADVHKRTPLCQVCTRGWHPDKGRRIRTAECLVQNGAQLDVKTWQNKTPADNARSHGFHDLALFLKNSLAKKEIFQASQAADILREHVAMGRKSQIIETLNDLGDNATKIINEYYLLHVAAAYWQHDVLELLLARGADVNNTGDKKVTPLFLAACELNLRAVQLLVKHGSDIKGKGYMFGVVFESGRQQFAGREDEIFEVLRYLWKHGAITTSLDKTLLHHAAENLHTDLISVLIKEFNQNVNAIDQYGRTPLHYISDGLDFWKIKQWRGIETAARLVKHGARVDVINDWRQTPAQTANSRGLRQFESWLRTLELLNILPDTNTYTIADTNSYSGDTDSYTSLCSDDIDSYTESCSSEFTDSDSDTSSIGDETGQRLLNLTDKLFYDNSDSDTASDVNADTRSGLNTSTNSDKSKALNTDPDEDSEKSLDSESELHKVNEILANEKYRLECLQQQYLPRYLKLLKADKDIDTEEQRTNMEINTLPTEKETSQFLETAALFRRLIIMGRNKSLIKKLGEFEDQVTAKIDKYSLLHTAARYGQLNSLVILAMHRSNINNQDENHDIALHIAARELDLHAVKLLVFFEANVRATNAAGWSVLHEIVAASHQPHYAEREAEAFEILQWLADRGAHTRALAPGGGTLLHFAAYALNVDLVDFLACDFQLDVNALDMAQQTPLYWISVGLNVLEADEEQAITAARCLLKLGARAKVVNRWNNTPAQYARAQGYIRLADCIEKFESQQALDTSESEDEEEINTAKSVLKFGAWYDIVNKCNDKNTYTSTSLRTSPVRDEVRKISDNALRTLVITGQTASLRKFLKELGEHVSKQISESCLIHEAIKHEQRETLKLLVAHQTDVNGKDDKNFTALHVATCGLDLRAAQILVTAGADIKATDAAGWSVLHALIYTSRAPEFAGCQEKALEMFRWLVKHGARTDAVSRNNETLVHMAAAALHTDFIDLLLGHFQLDSDAVTVNGYTPMHYVSLGLQHWRAEETRGISTAACLIKHGAHHDITNALHQTAAQYAHTLGFSKLAAYFENPYVQEVRFPGFFIGQNKNI